MFLLDSLLISGLQWTLRTVASAAEAEMNDDSALREQLLEAEMRRETGEISDAEFGEIEADLLARIREIKERREGSGPLAFGTEPADAAEGGTRGYTVEAEIAGDFHESGSAADTLDTTTVPPAPMPPADAPARGSRTRGPASAAARRRRR